MLPISILLIKLITFHRSRDFVAHFSKEYRFEPIAFFARYSTLCCFNLNFFLKSNIIPKARISNNLILLIYGLKRYLILYYSICLVSRIFYGELFIVQHFVVSGIYKA